MRDWLDRWHKAIVFVLLLVGLAWSMRRDAERKAAEPRAADLPECGPLVRAGERCRVVLRSLPPDCSPTAEGYVYCDRALTTEETQRVEREYFDREGK